MDKNHWKAYYTPTEIAKQTLQHIPKEFKPSVIIDICAGAGNFLNSVRQLAWENSKYIACDLNIDPELKASSDLDILKINSLEIDKLNKKIKSSGKKLLVANPPFGTSNVVVKSRIDNGNINELIKEANKLNRIEAQMIVSNLSLLKKGDLFAAILPENFFVAESFNDIRERILDQFKIIYCGPPSKYFKNCEVETRQFVAEFVGIQQLVNESKEPTSVRRLDTKGKVFSIRRGIDNSQLHDIKRANNREVLHFNNRRGLILKRKYIRNRMFKNAKAVNEKDVLIIRVGRSVGTVFKARGEHKGKLFSDYFYLVESPRLSDRDVINLQTLLLKEKKGLTTKYISMGDIKNAISKLGRL